MSLARIRSLLAAPTGTDPSRPPTPIPSWTLVPGLAALCAALFAYAQYVRNYHIWGLDLAVYQGGAAAFTHGQNPYALGFTADQLPYTYPPVSLLLFSPLTLFGHHRALYLMVAVSIAATAATGWYTLRLLNYTGTAGRIGVTAALTAVLLWTETVQLTLNLGQVNILLMLLVVADFALPARNRFKGALIGLAAAIKLVPAIFVLYLLLTRRLRAAAVAVASFVVLTLVGWAAAPTASTDYWLHGLFLRSNRVATIVGPRYVSNQSLHGLAVRLFGDTTTAALLWAAAGLAVAAAGMALAVWAHRRGEDAVGLVVVAVTALLLSPIAWAHHWVWIAPLLLVGVDIARRLGKRTRHLALAVLAATLAVFVSWPIRATANSPLLAQSLIWRAPPFHPDHDQRYTSPIQWIFGESYTLTALALFALVALWLRATRPGPDQAATPNRVSAATG
jgi:alpha-1,2-mannosyltransferase